MLDHYRDLIEPALWDDLPTIQRWYFDLLRTKLGSPDRYPLPTGTKTSHPLYWVHALMGEPTTLDDPARELPCFWQLPF